MPDAAATPATVPEPSPIGRLRPPRMRTGRAAVFEVAMRSAMCPSLLIASAQELSLLPVSSV
nr:hypothetical protein GCM10020092_076030 [Actinoplanes digitatis]